jgi:hypothetical protein
MAKNTKYVSDATNFLREMIKDKPELKNKQKELRSTWWDRDDIDQAELKSYKDSDVPVHGYSYYD